jgi:aminomethyltransferase
MPVQYKSGLIAEHKQTRESAGLFDVSHMGQLQLVGPDAAAALESLMPVDVIGLGVDKQRYGLLLNDGRHPRRPDVRQPGRPSVPDRQRRLQGGRHRPHPGAHRQPLPGHPCPIRPCWPCKARRPSPRCSAWCPACRRWCS